MQRWVSVFLLIKQVFMTYLPTKLSKPITDDPIVRDDSYDQGLRTSPWRALQKVPCEITTGR